MAVFGYATVARIIAFAIVMLFYGENTEFIKHQTYMLRKFSFSIFFSLILPTMYLYKRKDLRQFISSYIIPKLYCYIRIKKSTKNDNGAVDNFASLNTPGDPGGIKVVDWNKK